LNDRKQIYTIKYENGSLKILDQTKLPNKIEYVCLESTQQVVGAIKDMMIRGAPAIGICAAYGMCIAARECGADKERLAAHAFMLREARPTAKNLSWAVKRMTEAADKPGDLITNLENEAEAIRFEDEYSNRKIGENLLSLLPENGVILTYCNAGALATSKYGTALSPVYLGLERGRKFKVFACETRPLLQGARLTSFELKEAGVDVTLICDNNAGNILREGKIDAVITGCDRVAANGDTANKVGTYAISILARTFDIPFYIAAPTSTIDISIKYGSEIVIEQRGEKEVTEGFGTRTVPEGVKVLNPAFDVTPAKNITAIVTEQGIFRGSEKNGDFKLYGMLY
jgi:methylthioribose-1-phosphate isomerase